MDSGFDAAAAVVARIMGPRTGGVAGGRLAQGPQDPPAGSSAGARTRLADLYPDRGGRRSALRNHSPSAARCRCSDVSAVGEGGSRRRAEQLAAAKLLRTAAARDTEAGMSESEVSRRACGHRRPAECRQIDPGQCPGGPQGVHRHRQAANHAASYLGRGQPARGAAGAGRYAGPARIDAPRDESVHEPGCHLIVPGCRCHPVRDRGDALHRRGPVGVGACARLEAAACSWWSTRSTASSPRSSCCPSSRSMTERIPASGIVPVSALESDNLDRLVDVVGARLPVSPPLFASGCGHRPR